MRSSLNGRFIAASAIETGNEAREGSWLTRCGVRLSFCSIRHGNRVYMTPSGVQKERILPEELYVLDMR